MHTGCFYNKDTGRYLGKVKRKELLEIWRAKGVLKIIIEERAIYEELHKKNPIRFPELPPLLMNHTNIISPTRTIRSLERQSLYTHKTISVRSHLSSKSRSEAPHLVRRNCRRKSIYKLNLINSIIKKRWK